MMEEVTTASRRLLAALVAVLLLGGGVAWGMSRSDAPEQATPAAPVITPTLAPTGLTAGRVPWDKPLASP